jgi:hypothetical protein
MSLASELQAVAESVPGVTGVFPTLDPPRAAIGTVMGTAIGTAIGLITGAAPDAVLVTDDAVTLTIGVSPAAPASATCRAVYEALAAHLAASSLSPRIRILVAQIG